MSNGNIVSLLAKARSALYAIAKTYDDHELRARALEVYESTAPETVCEDPDRTLSAGWRRLTDSLPDADRYPRVLIYTEGVDFNGEQFFDVSADSLNENSYESPDDQPEVCRAATHWMVRPFVDANALPGAPAGQWVHCSPSLVMAGVSCAHTPRRACACRPENGGHDHFIAFNDLTRSRAPTARTECVGNPGWTSVEQRLPEVQSDEFYGDEHSKPVLVRLETEEGRAVCSIWAWKYSYRWKGWVRADMYDGYEPEHYRRYGRVTHWTDQPDTDIVSPPPQPA